MTFTNTLGIIQTATLETLIASHHQETGTIVPVLWMPVPQRIIKGLCYKCLFIIFFSPSNTNFVQILATK